MRGQARRARSTFLIGVVIVLVLSAAVLVLVIDSRHDDGAHRRSREVRRLPKEGIVLEGDEIAAVIRQGDYDHVTAMLAASPELIHAADVDGNRPIHWAVMTHRLSMIDLMLDRGADINVLGPDGTRPIDSVYGNCYYRKAPADAVADPAVVIGYLLARGADYDLDIACRVGDLARVRELLEEDSKLAHEL